MRNKLSTLIILICLAFALFNTVYAGKIHARHKTKLFRQTAGTDSLPPDSITQFARSLIGTPYRHACSNPLVGFDCSGFVNYVFKRFNFDVPRSSREFISVGEKIRFEDAMPGDIILFTGTKKHKHGIGHIGIVLCNEANDFRFIHSTSGKEYCVTITAMDDNYRRRFVQIVRLLKWNDWGSAPAKSGSPKTGETLQLTSG